MNVLFYLRGLNIGGAETFIYNIMSHIDCERFHIDIVLQNNDIKNDKLLSLCKEKGCNIYFTTPFEKNYLKSIIELNTIIRKNNYSVIHYHANSLINMVPVICAIRNNIRLVVHSHNSNNNMGGIIGRELHYFNRWILSHYNIRRVACGPEAGKWMFGNCKYEILNNAIDLNAFQYSDLHRKEIRRRYSITEKQVVIGHVGRFVEAKNHAFLLDCFERFTAIVPNSVLMLVGNGELYESIVQIVERKKLFKKVIFVGEVQESKKFYSAFDVMVFPSLFEGLPFTLVEAQASGLPVVASDTIAKDVNLTGLIKYVSLKAKAENWAFEVRNILLQDNNRVEYHNLMSNSIFDIDRIVHTVEYMYESIS